MRAPRRLGTQLALATARPGGLTDQIQIKRVSHAENVAVATVLHRRSPTYLPRYAGLRTNLKMNVQFRSH